MKDTRVPHRPAAARGGSGEGLWGFELEDFARAQRVVSAPESGVEALDESILPWAARPDAERLDAGALPLAERALAIRLKSLDPGHSNLADCYELLGKVHSGLRNDEEAEVLVGKQKGIEYATVGKRPDADGE